MANRENDFFSAFDNVDIQTGYLESILQKVLSIISKYEDMQDISFGPLHEGKTFSGYASEVTEDGVIYLDSEKLKQLDDDVALALIAHELAHSHLGHSNTGQRDLNEENEADELARKWGFDVDKFRRVCGPPTIQK
jgi:hypothetical protein